jgi:hypothetical protein
MQTLKLNIGGNAVKRESRKTACKAAFRDFFIYALPAAL